MKTRKYKYINNGEDGTPSVLMINYQGEWIKTDLTLKRNPYTEGVVNEYPFLNPLSFDDLKDLTPPVHELTAFDSYSHSVTPNELHFLSTPIVEERYSCFYLTVDEASGKIRVRSIEEIRNMVSTYWVDEVEAFDYFTPDLTQVQKFVDFLNEKLWVAEGRDRINYCAGLPSMVSEKRKKTFHIPGIALAWISLFTQNLGWGRSDAEARPFKPIIEGDSYADSMIRENALIIDYKGQSLIEYIFEHYDFSSVKSLFHSELDQIWMVSTGLTEFLDVGDSLILSSGLWEKGLAPEFQGDGVLENLDFDPGSRALSSFSVDSDSVLATLSVKDKVRTFFIPFGDDLPEDFYPYILSRDNLTLRPAEGYKGLIHTLYGDNSVSLKSVDERIGSLAYFLRCYTTDIDQRYTHLIAKFLTMRIEESDQGSVPGVYKGVDIPFFDTVGMTISPLTYLTDGDRTVILPITNSPISGYQDKRVHLLRQNSESYKEHAYFTIQPVGGDRVPSAYPYPGAIFINNKTLFKMKDDNIQSPELDDGNDCNVCEKISEILDSISTLDGNVSTKLATEKYEEGIVQLKGSIEALLQGIKHGGDNTDPRLEQIVNKLGTLQATIDSQERGDHLDHLVTEKVSEVKNQLTLVQKVLENFNVGWDTRFATIASINVMLNELDESSLTNNAWLEQSKKFITNKLETDPKGRATDIAYHPAEDEIFVDERTLKASPVKLSDDAYATIVVTNPQMNVPKYPINIGKKIFKWGKSKVVDSSDFLETSALCMSPKVLSAGVLRGSLFTDVRERLLSRSELDLSSLKESAVRLTPILTLDEEKEYAVLGYVSINDNGFISYNEDISRSYSGYLPIVIRVSDDYKVCDVLIHPSYPDVWLTATMQLLSKWNVVSFLDAASLVYVRPRMTLHSLEQLTRQDVYARRLELVIGEFSSCMLIELLKYNRTLLAGPYHSLNRVSDFYDSVTLLDMYFLHEDRQLSRQIRSMFDDGLAFSRIEGVSKSNIFTFSDNHAFYSAPKDKGAAELCTCDLASKSIFVL